MRKGTRGTEHKEAKSLRSKIAQAFKDKAMDVVEALFGSMQKPSVAVNMIDIHPKVVCNLPSCTRTHKHNGGYCCAEHSSEHVRVVKLPFVFTKAQLSWRLSHKLPGGLLVPTSLMSI